MNVKTQPEKKPVVQAASTPKPAQQSVAGWIVLLLVMIIGCISAALIAQKGGWLFGEADMFLVDHNSPDRSFISKIICPHAHDASAYQARELSHFFEFFDAKFIHWCTINGHPHFFSIINFVFLTIISVAHFRYSTKYLRMDPLISILLIGLFWTAPSVFFSGIYVRVAKQGAALMLFFLAWHIVRNTGFVNDFRKFLNPQTPAFKAILWIQTFLFTLAMCWMDRQGYYIAAIFCVTLVAFWVGPKIPYRGLLISAMVAGLLAHTIYGRYIGPDLIRKYTGFEVSFQYQKLPLDKFFEKLGTFLWQGSVLLVDNFRYYFANFTGGLTLFIWAGICWIFSKARLRMEAAAAPASARFELKSFFAYVFLGWVGMLILMNALMVLRHEPLVWPDVRTFYYWIPTTVLILLGVTFAIHVTLQRFTFPVWLPRVVLLAFLISNITALPEHNRITRSGHMQGYIAAAPHLLKALKDLANTPKAPVSKKKFDTLKLSRIENDWNAILKNPLANPNMTVEEFIFSSSYYNFLRSEWNLEFRQP